MSGWIVATLLALGWLWGTKRKPRDKRPTLEDRIRCYTLKNRRLTAEQFERELKAGKWVRIL